jgi:hypothetical protein
MNFKFLLENVQKKTRCLGGQRIIKKSHYHNYLSSAHSLWHTKQEAQEI